MDVLEWFAWFSIFMLVMLNFGLLGIPLCVVLGWFANRNYDRKTKQVIGTPKGIIASSGLLLIGVGMLFL